MTLIKLLRYHGAHCLSGEQSRTCLEAADEIERLRTALHTIFCNTEVDAIPHPSYDILAQIICDTAAAALGYEKGKPTIEQVHRAMETRDAALSNQQSAPKDKP